ncbi:hypothetical protein L211DRAFT_195512 [Terfezia boudieri ATCC MYA-4762]|uniref:Uncharacterized protein n=1 Tax=Terfezia boudieri ATCC MYA-4762 TaxID=1051890 RepID=A0A3N4LNA6_9PEZI|nr:hypothetical protein L211DRAFT_195512 [Terfezia boudieri ATCC MYA-4762]
MAKRLQREFDQEVTDPPSRSSTTTQPLIIRPTNQRPLHVIASSQASSSSTFSSKTTSRNLQRAGLTQLRFLDLQESCGPWCYGECDKTYLHLYGTDVTNHEIWNFWDIGAGNTLLQTDQTQKPRDVYASLHNKSATVDFPGGSKGYESDSSKGKQEASDLKMAKRLHKEFDEEAGDTSDESSDVYEDAKIGLEDSLLSSDYQSTGTLGHEANYPKPGLRHIPAYSSPLRLGYYGADAGTYISTTVSERGKNSLKGNGKRHGWGLKKSGPSIWRQLLIGLGFVANHLCKKSANGCICEYERDELLGEPEIFSTIPRVTLKGLPQVKEKCDFCIDKDFEIGRQHLQQLRYRGGPDIPDDDTVVGDSDDESDDEDEDDDEGEGLVKKILPRPRLGEFVDSEEDEKYGYPLQKHRSVVRQGPNHAVIKDVKYSSSSSSSGRAETAVEGDSPSDEEVAAHGLFSDLPDEYRIGIRSYLWGTLCSILTDLLKRCPHHTTEPQAFLLLLKQVVTPAYYQLLRYLSTMRLFTTRHAQETRGMELSRFAMQLALELYWKIRRHVERGGGEQEIVEIVDTCRIHVAQTAHRPPGPPRLSPTQPWKTPDLHKERLIAHARGANEGRGELRTKTGLPHFSGDPLAFRYPRKYGRPPPGFEGLSYGIRGPEVATILRGNNRAEAGDRGRGSAWLSVKKGKVRVQANRRQIRTRERATIAQRRIIFRKNFHLQGPRKEYALKFLRSPDLILLRKQRRLSKTYVRNTIKPADEKELEVEDQDKPSKRGKREGRGQGIKDDGEGRVLCDDEDTDSDNSGEDDAYFEDAADVRVGGDKGSRKDMGHSNEHGDKEDDAGDNADGDTEDGDDSDCDNSSVEHSRLKSGKPVQIEGNGSQVGDGEDSDDDSDDDFAVGEWVANVEELIQVEIQKDIRKREKAMATLRGARERLKRDPKFRQLPSARRRWVTVEPSGSPTAPKTSSSGQSFNTSTNMLVVIRGGFDGLSNNAKSERRPVPSVVVWQAPPLVETSFHQPRKGSGPPPAPRQQHTSPSPVSRPPFTAFTQPSFRFRSTPLTPPSSPLPTPRLLPLTTQSASWISVPTSNPYPLAVSAHSSDAFLQPSFRSPYVQPSPQPAQSPGSTQSDSRTSVPSSIQYPPTASTSSGAAFPQSSFSNSYVLPSIHSPPPSYPSTHNHPLPVSMPSSAVSSHPFFTSPYDQPHPQTIPSPTQFASPISASSSTQSHPNLLVSSSSSQLLPST